MKKKKIPLYKLFPSIITILALCMGITAIKYTFERNFEMAVIMVIVACIMDGLDGPSARFLKSASDFGAQLDSLCDLVNFGVAPAIIIYNWALYKIGGVGWIIVLIYTSCTALRLARYNAESVSQQGKIKHNIYFHGISSPCAAILALSPLISTFKLCKEELINIFVLGCFIIFIALMMVSRIPTISTFVMGVFAILVASIFLMPWQLIPILSIIYIISIPFTWYHYKKRPLCKFLSESNQE